MAQSYLTITNILQQFIDKHKGLQGRGQIASLDQINNFSHEDTRFPLFFGALLDVYFGTNSDIYTFRIYCVDLLQKDRSNYGSIMNHTLLILRDFVNWVERDELNHIKQLITQPRAIPVNNFLMDYTVGYYIDIEFETTTILSDCVIPFADYPYQTGVTCDVQYVAPFLTCETLQYCGNFIDIVNNSVTTNHLSAVTLSAQTIYSGTTDVSNIFFNGLTRVQPGINTFTGGTMQFPTVNITGGTFYSIDSQFYTSGGTKLENIFGNGSNILLGKSNIVYIFGSAQDASAAGGPDNNAFTTFQAAYNRATEIQTGTTPVLISVLNTTSGGTGDLRLSADYNTRIRVEGYSFNSSQLGSIIASGNTSGNSFNVGGTTAAASAYFSNVNLQSIITRPGLSGFSAGRVTLFLNSVIMGNIFADIPLAGWVGNGGSVMISAPQTTVGNLLNIQTTARVTSASAGTVTIDAPQYSFGNITTASNNTGGAVNISNIGNVGNININSSSIINNSFLNNRACGGLSIGATGGTTTFNNWLNQGVISLTNTTGIKTINATDSTFGSYTTTSAHTSNLNKCSALQLNGIGLNSRILGTVINSSVNIASGASQVVMQNCSINTLFFANSVPMVLIGTNGSNIDGLGANSNVQNCSFYSSINVNGNNCRIFGSSTQNFTVTGQRTGTVIRGTSIQTATIPAGVIVNHVNSYIPPASIAGGGIYNDLQPYMAIQDGVNTYTGGTALATTVNLSDDIILNSVDSQIITSGGTSLYDIFDNTNFSEINFGDVDNKTTSSPKLKWFDSASNLSILGTNALSSDASGVGITNDAFNTLAIYVQPSGKVTNWTGTSIPLANTSFVDAGIGGTKKLIVAGSDIYTLPGTNAWANGTHIDEQGLSVGPLSGLAAANTALFTAGKLSTDGIKILSGGTDLYDIFCTDCSGGGPGGPSTYVQPGTNTYTGGSNNYPTINVVDSPSFANIAFSGVAVGDDGQVLLSLNGGTGQFITGNGTELSISDSAFKVVLNGVPAITVDDVIGAIQLQNYEVKVDDLGGIGTRMVVAMSDGLLKTQTIPSGGGSVTYVQPGLNTYTGGTASAPTVNISAATLASAYITDFTGFTSNAFTSNAFTFNGNNVVANSGSFNTFSANTYTSGGTPLQTIIQNIANSLEQNDITRVQPGTNILTAGTANAPIINLNNEIELDALVVNTQTDINGDLFLNGIDINSKFAPFGTLGDVSRVQPGLNTYTGGTPNAPTINISAVTLSSASITSFSAGTLYSGSTPLTTIITNIANSLELNDVTRVQNGANITTGGTANAPTINLGDNITLTSIVLNDTLETNNILTTSLQATGTANFDGGLFVNGSDIYSLIDSFSTLVQPGTNITTGGTETAPIINVVASPSFTNVTATTFYSGSTPLSTVITNIANSLELNDITRVQGGSNTTTGGTANAPTINVVASPFFNVITASGTSQLTGAVIQNLSANTVSAFAVNAFSSTVSSVGSNTITGQTYYSGNTTLAQAIINLEDVTRVQPGSNIQTGGTANAPTIRLVDSPNVFGINVSAVTTTRYISLPSGTTSSAAAAGAVYGTLYNNGDADSLLFFNSVGQESVVNHTQVLVNNSINRQLDYSYTQLIFTGTTQTKWNLPREKRNFSLTIANASNKTLTVQSFATGNTIWDIANTVTANFSLLAGQARKFVSDGTYFFVY